MNQQRKTYVAIVKEKKKETTRQDQRGRERKNANLNVKKIVLGIALKSQQKQEFNQKKLPIQKSRIKKTKNHKEQENQTGTNKKLGEKLRGEDEKRTNTQKRRTNSVYQNEEMQLTLENRIKIVGLKQEEQKGRKRKNL